MREYLSNSSVCNKFIDTQLEKIVFLLKKCDESCECHKPDSTVQNSTNKILVWFRDSILPGLAYTVTSVLCLFVIVRITVDVV